MLHGQQFVHACQVLAFIDYPQAYYRSVVQILICMCLNKTAQLRENLKYTVLHFLHAKDVKRIRMKTAKVFKDDRTHVRIIIILENSTIRLSLES